jgi:hypothetical protein
MGLADKIRVLDVNGDGKVDQKDFEAIKLRLGALDFDGDK